MLEGAAVGAGGFHEAEVTAGDVDPTVDAQGDVVGGVVGGAVLEAEGDVGDEAFGAFGDAVVILIVEDGDVGWVEEVEAVVVPDEAAGGVDVADEFGDFVGAAILIEVAQAEDASAVGVASERAIAIGGDVEIALGGGRDVDGVVGHLPGGEEGDVEAIGDLDVFEDFGFFFRGGFVGDGWDVAGFFVAGAGDGLELFGFFFVENGEEFEGALGSFEFEFPEGGPHGALLFEEGETEEFDVFGVEFVGGVGWALVCGSVVGDLP